MASRCPMIRCRAIDPEIMFIPIGEHSWFAGCAECGSGGPVADTKELAKALWYEMYEIPLNELFEEDL